MAQLLDVPAFKDTRGNLLVFQEICPFEIKRVFYITEVDPELVRAEHGHIKNRMLLTSANGSCDIYINNGRESSVVSLNSRDKALLLEPEDWHRLYNLSKDCVLLAICSEEYSEADYFFEEPNDQV